MIRKIAPGIYALLLVLLIIKSSQSQTFTNNQEWQGPHSLLQLSEAPVALIPFPQKTQWINQRFVLNPNTVIAYTKTDADIAFSAIRSLKDILKENAQPITKENVGEEKPGLDNSIRLQIDKTLAVKNEGYSLEVNRRTVLIIARDAAGLYYGIQTLRQLLQKKDRVLFLPGCNIMDWPAFPIRGFMHDNGRNFQSITMLKQQLEKLSHYKYNTFHWHLTDNPAWRVQSKIYPQLNKEENRNPNREPDSSYTFDAIRELIRFARERNIAIIPELDMPGHSRFFEPTFSFKMESEQGMKVLENLIDEFCKEIPANDCPILHIGSDEVRIGNPEVFISRMTARVKANARKVMVWNPGLPPVPGTIEQVWMDDATKGERKSNNPYVDSYGGYLNYFDAFTLIQRYFFQQVCNKPAGDSMALGGRIRVSMIKPK
jgi:hexosaminidase